MSLRARRWIAYVAILVVLMVAMPVSPASAASVENKSVTEGNSGSIELQILITGPFEPNDSIRYVSSGGTATAADNDYQPVDALAVCPSGGAVCPTLFAYVTVNGDTKVEPDEIFYIDVAGVGTSTITIFNDDVDTPPDTTPPSLTLPGNLVEEATGPAGAVVNYSVSASDADSPPATVTCDPASGATFPIGTTTVTCNASDAIGNTSSGSFNVTVQDTNPPAVTVPGDTTVEATGPAGAVVTFSASAIDTVDGALTPSCSPASGTTFSLGTTAVSCSAMDAAGNTGTGGFNVTVVDTTPPSLSLPADITTNASSPGGAAVDFAASASDLVDGTVAVACTPSAGNTFAIGTTVVNCSATDAAGNSANGSFSVTVLGADAQLDDQIASIQGLPGVNGGIANSLTSKLQQVQANLVAGNTTAACNQLDAYINQLEAQRGMFVPDNTATMLIGNADQIKAVLGCG